MIQLQHVHAYTYTGMMRYLIAYNTHAGLPDMYDAFILTTGEPWISGREIPLDLCREIIDAHERAAKSITGFAGRYGEIKRAMTKARQERRRNSNVS